MLARWLASEIVPSLGWLKGNNAEQLPSDFNSLSDLNLNSSVAFAHEQCENPAGNLLPTSYRQETTKLLLRHNSK